MIPVLVVSHPPSKPTMIYDGDCGFCKKWIHRWHCLTGDKVLYEPHQKVAISYPEIPLERFEKAVQMIAINGRVTQGAEAVFNVLAVIPLLRVLPWIYAHLPGFSWLSETLYRWVATHRHLLSSAASCDIDERQKPSPSAKP